MINNRNKTIVNVLFRFLMFHTSALHQSIASVRTDYELLILILTYCRSRRKPFRIGSLPDSLSRGVYGKPYGTGAGEKRKALSREAQGGGSSQSAAADLSDMYVRERASGETVWVQPRAGDPYSQRGYDASRGNREAAKPHPQRPRRKDWRSRRR